MTLFGCFGLPPPLNYEPPNDTVWLVWFTPPLNDEPPNSIVWLVWFTPPLNDEPPNGIVWLVWASVSSNGCRLMASFG